MSFGLTDDGFVIKRQPNIIADLEESFRSEFGNINVNPASVFGQIIGVESQPLIDLWELAQLVYLSQYPSSAEGVSLDNVAALTGITRLPSTPTVVEGILVGDQGTFVEEGKQASILDTGDLFETTEDKTIDKADVLACSIEITSVLDLTLYAVIIDGELYDYTSDASATESEILSGLEIAVNGGQSAVTATVNGSQLDLQVDDFVTSISVTLSATGIAFLSLSTPVTFQSKVTGSIAAPAGTLTVIETPVSGWDSINNLSDGTTGRDIETDIELRARRRISLSIIGAGTVEAIRARILQEVDGVTNVSVYDNRQDYYLASSTIIVTVDTAENTTDYSVYINSTEFTITSDANATIEEIALALTNAINLGSELVTATDNTDGTFDVVPDADGALINFTVGLRMTQSNARPPHSFESVVLGGTDEDVGTKIWLLKPAGIRTWGNTSFNVTDSQGDLQTMFFSRPVNRYAWIRYRYNLNSEETFPADGEDQIIAAAVALGNTFGIGDDFILQKFFSPIYSVEGVSFTSLQIAITDAPGGTPSYVSVNIAIGQVGIALFDLSRIDIAVI